ncbi:MAG: hypothetical protein KGH78_03970 [Candidatus Micrarchaeota archaeon]|nr:hypothetical protein [Candidatus Micrarchaeota archaeon]
MSKIRSIGSYIETDVNPIYGAKQRDLNMLVETFVVQQYRWLIERLRNGTVAIDIGAGIGDSGVYIAGSDRIRKVHSFEANPSTFRRAKRYIALSPFAKKIEITNRKVEDISGILRGKRNVIIKCDCEGSEHSIFKADLDLSDVYRIQMEYHHGVGAIPGILREKGFRVSTQKLEDTIRFGEVGFIYAERK